VHPRLRSESTLFIRAGRQQTLTQSVGISTQTVLALALVAVLDLGNDSPSRFSRSRHFDQLDLSRVADYLSRAMRPIIGLSDLASVSCEIRD
jgi:hypothetical protein